MAKKKKKKKKKATLIGVIKKGAKTKVKKGTGATYTVPSKSPKRKITTQNKNKSSTTTYTPPSGLGSFGKTIVFSVSANRALPFKNMKREVAGRWKEHEIVGKKPKAEFCGPDVQEIKMTITLSAEHGVKPRQTMDAIAKACEKGTTDYLVVGGKVVGTGKMRITGISEAWERVLNKGEVTRAVLDVTFREYL